MKKVISYNPANGEITGEAPVLTKEDVASAVAKAKKAFQSWKKTSFAERASYVFKMKDLLIKHKEEIAILTTKEMGKPLSEAREDIDFELGFLDYYAQNAERILGEKVIGEDERAIYKTVYEPWGVCASIAPWNFPISMASSGITAQLLAGNTVVFKPSEYTTLTQKLFVDLFNQTKLPEGVLQYVVGDGQVGKMLIDADIDLVWFTGSTRVGQAIYRQCAKKFIKCILELGGSSPGIVFADCDFAATVEIVFSARFYNCGQVCSAIKRLFVEESIFEPLVKQLVKRVSQVKLSDPLKEAGIGPLVSKKQLETLMAQVDDAVAKGARVLIGGKRPQETEFAKGNYYEPAILTNVTREMRVYKEEVFGPVLPIMPFKSEEEAISLANDTQYGLTAEVFTKDKEKGMRVARAIAAGGVSINGDLIYAPHCPIGGFLKSGLGREYGEEGFRELAQLKYLCVFK